jgi:hypothetical protein
MHRSQWSNRCGKARRQNHSYTLEVFIAVND